MESGVCFVHLLLIFTNHSAVNDPLRSDIAVAARRHLTVPESVQTQTYCDALLSVAQKNNRTKTYIDTPRANILSYCPLEE